ncbi:hypothetical protein E4T43_01441 [Aureobasidium subglaciale]|nr:hypothetical protein E4T43_01441 [Aureobasidium subglaciale]
MTFFHLLTALAAATPALAAIYPVTVPAAADGSAFFPGTQSGVGSWYRASSSQDSTSGTGWCGKKYSDSDPVIAVYFTAMSANDATYNSDQNGWRTATRKYCGLEALVTDPATGKQKLMYIADAFDPRYVTGMGHPKASLDIMLNSWSELYGKSPNGNKNLVINPVQWVLTGNINTQWTADGAVWPTKTGGIQTKTSTSPAKTCEWGCLGWDCSATVPCQSPNVCVSGYCRSSAATTTVPTSAPTCSWGCLGWDCSASVPCQSPNVCVNNYCRASATPSICAGCEGSSCGASTACNAGLTCLSPDGLCKNAACNWGCTGWSCSASSPCQLPNKCVGGVCQSS